MQSPAVKRTQILENEWRVSTVAAYGLHIRGVIAGIDTFFRSVPWGQNPPPPPSLLFGAGNFGKIWYACRQHEIQHTK